MAAFAHAVALGVDAVECDVHLSADGEAVLIHDDTLDRTTDATGPVSLQTARELAAVDAGARFGPDRQYP
jgi:glycerophosphoryl diester phosphodiesterase